MKLSELIAKANAAFAEHGDIDVVINGGDALDIEAWAIDVVQDAQVLAYNDAGHVKRLGTSLRIT